MVVVAAVLPNPLDRAMLIHHFPRALLLVVVVLAFEVHNAVDVWLPGNVFSFAFSDVPDKGALKLVPVRKFEGSLSPHEVFLEVASIDCVVCKFVYSSPLLEPVFEGSLVDVSIRTHLFSFSLRHSSHDLTRIDPAILQLEVIDLPGSH